MTSVYIPSGSYVAPTCQDKESAVVLAVVAHSLGVGREAPASGSGFGVYETHLLCSSDNRCLSRDPVVGSVVDHSSTMASNTYLAFTLARRDVSFSEFHCLYKQQDG